MKQLLLTPKVDNKTVIFFFRTFHYFSTLLTVIDKVIVEICSKNFIKKFKLFLFIRNKFVI